MPDAAVHVRRASHADLAVLGRLGAHLMHVHYEFDRRRFVAPAGDPRISDRPAVCGLSS